MNNKQLKNSILQWAIQGKLVPQDPNDEPASVLLERIRKEKERLVKEKKIKKDKNASIIFRGEDNSYYEKFLATGEVKCIDEEIHFDLPFGWEWCRLKNIGVTETGTTPTKSHPEYFGNTIPFYGPGNIQDNKISSVTQGISEQGLPFSRIVPPHTILQVCIGGSIGKAAIVDSECSFNQQINSITVHNGINTLYAFYVLISEFFKQQIVDKSTGTATPIINRSNWENLLIPIPPNAEQRQIIAKLAELLPIVEKYDKSQHELDVLNVSVKEQLQKSILQEAIQGKLVPQIAEESTAQELLEQIRQEKQKLVKEGKLKKSALNDSVVYKGDDNKYWEKVGKEETCIDDKIPFEIPDSWCWIRHNDIFEISGGSQPPKSHFSDTPRDGYIRLYQIRDYGKNPVPVYIPIKEANKLTIKGDIILARYGASLGKVFWAEDGAYNVAMAKVVPLYASNLICKEFIFLFYCSNIYQNAVKDHSRCAQAGFNKDDLSELFFPLPPYEEQIRIVRKYKEAVASIMSRQTTK